MDILLGLWEAAEKLLSKNLRANLAFASVEK